MITADLWRLKHPSAPKAMYVGPRVLVEHHRDQAQLGPPESYIIEREPCCQCCGYSQFVRGLVEWPNGQARCLKHRDRNPCAIEGCQRTTKAVDKGRYDDAWLCAEHWRRYVPPRSRTRRAYNRYWQKAKRYGWTPELRVGFWRFWDLLIRQARRRATEGFVDEAEIKKIMGW